MDKSRRNNRRVNILSRLKISSVQFENKSPAFQKKALFGVWLVVRGRDEGILLIGCKIIGEMYDKEY